MKFARRIGQITPFKVMDILAAAVALQKSGVDVIRMEVGEPTFDTPQPIVEAAQWAIVEGQTKYTPASGIDELKEKIARFYHQRYGVHVESGRIVITTGSSAALGMVCELLLNPEDGLLLSDPGYACNPNFIRRLDAEPQLVPVNPDNNFQLTAALADQYWQENTKGILLASPNNPTGEMITRSNLVAMKDLVAKREGQLIVDEIYHGLTYGDVEEVSALKVSNDAYVINSFSKYFGMTGWRLGWTVVPELAVESINRLAQNFYISPPTISQYAALAAFDSGTSEILEARRQEFQKRRDFLVAGLKDLGFGINHSPSGAFYVYADISSFTDNCEAFCWDMLREQGVALTPGTDFGLHNAEKYVRFTYTENIPRLQIALERLAKGLKKYQ